MSANEVDVKQAQEILLKMVKTDIVPFLWGPPGIGKSSIVKQTAEQLGWDIIDLRLSLLNPVDLRGLPIVDKKKHAAEWLKPGFLPTDDNKKPGILFLDEINLAHQSVQAAAYQLILDKKLGEYHFPKHWKIIAAGNREIDKANVYKISAPLANRFIHLTILEDYKIWREWASANKIRREIIDYVVLKPTQFLQMPSNNEKSFPSPRSWHFVSNVLDTFEYNGGEPDELLKSVIMGTIGEGVGKELCAYLTKLGSQDINKLIEDFYASGNIKMPSETDIRFTIIRKVVKDYKERNITNATYLKFQSYLKPEEKAGVQQFEKANVEKINAKYNI